MVVFFIFDKKKFIKKIGLFLILVILPITFFEYSINLQINKEMKNLDNTNSNNLELTKKNRLFEGKHFNLEVKVKDKIM